MPPDNEPYTYQELQEWYGDKAETGWGHAQPQVTDDEGEEFMVYDDLWFPSEEDEQLSEPRLFVFDLRWSSGALIKHMELLDMSFRQTDATPSGQTEATHR